MICPRLLSLLGFCLMRLSRQLKWQAQKQYTGWRLAQRRSQEINWIWAWFPPPQKKSNKEEVIDETATLKGPRKQQFAEQLDRTGQDMANSALPWTSNSTLNSTSKEKAFCLSKRDDLKNRNCQNNLWSRSPPELFPGKKLAASLLELFGCYISLERVHWLRLHL